MTTSSQASSNDDFFARFPWVVHEFGITQDELHLADDYMNRAGQAGVCRSLLDVALAMTSIDATVRVSNGTRPNLEGPYHDRHPIRPDRILLDRDPGPGAERLTLSGAVTDAATGLPIPGAHVDLWQADHGGHYDLAGSHLRGILVTDAEGRYRATTIVPLDYSDHDADPIGELFRAMGRHNRRAAHIHAKISVDGVECLTTQLFIPGSPYLDSDYVEGAVSPDLIIELIADEDAASRDGPLMQRAQFDFVVSRVARELAA